MSDHIQLPEDMPHILAIQTANLPQQHIEYPTRAAAIAAARKAREDGYVDHTDASGQFILMETKGAIYIVVSKAAVQQQLTQTQVRQRIVQPGMVPGLGQGH